MKHIIKADRSKALDAWRVKESENPVYKDRPLAYSDLRNPTKDNLKLELIAEQYRLCAYCCQRISLSTSHIEHLRPRSLDPNNQNGTQLDFQNLVLSCPGDREDDGARVQVLPPRTQLHCGHAKKNWYDEQTFVSPLHTDVEDRFQVFPSGTLSSWKPSPIPDEDPATTTIHRLNLNCALLIRQRKEVFYRTLTTIIQGLVQPSRAQILDRIKQLEERFGRPNGEGSLASFQFVILAALRFKHDQIMRA